MPAHLFLGKVNLDLFYPPFLERVLELKTRCRARGALYLSTFGHRTYEESDKLHQIYRTGGPRAAPAGYSSHNFGLADDEAYIVTEKPKRVCRWNIKDFDILGEEAVKLGLHWGAGYGDCPHISWPGFVNGAELKPLREIWQKSQGLLLLPRLQRCWDFVTLHSNVPPFTPSFQ
jgi:peptidoglycan LD-endopeptidase CwlK